MDRGETRNLINDPESAAAAAACRAHFAEYCAASHDDFQDLEWFAETRWRSHPIGYDRHNDPGCAPFPDGANGPKG